MKSAVVAVIVLVDLVTPQCISSNDHQQLHSDPDLSNMIDFSLGLLKSFNPKATGGNLFFSPYSIWNILILAYFGTAGNTQKALENALGLTGKSDTLASYRALSRLYSGRSTDKKNAYVINQANRIFVHKDLPLKTCVTRVLPDEFQEIDITQTSKAAAIINNFVNQTTRGKISRIVSERNLAGESTFFLVNAIYFKGTWLHPFKPADTKLGDFYPTPETPKKVEMMTALFNLKTGRSVALGAEVLEMPYSGEACMYILLPDLYPENCGDETPINCIVGRLTATTFQAAINSLVERNVKITMPKFTVKQTFRSQKIKTALKERGITDLFSSSTDLTNYDPSGKANFGNGIIHKVVVVVNELGTEAAGATSSFSRIIVPFFCVRPFVFIIYEKQANNILFAGIYRDPDTSAY